MVNDNVLLTMLNKFDIYYDDALISKEDIIKKYAEFFCLNINKKERRVSFALHTGSICFDIISIVIASLGCIMYNMQSNDNILASLQEGDIVMYKRGRYRWKNTAVYNGIKYLVLEKDGKGKNGNPISKIPYEKNKHLIKPYYGSSKRTDSRGIRKRESHREEFLAKVFDIPISDVPSLIDVSVVIIASRNEFSEIIKHLTIVYKENSAVNILDILPAAYYTCGGEEYPFANNTTKTQPVLKVTGSMSMARELVLDKIGNKVVGLLAVGINSWDKNGTELEDLLSRKNLKFAHVTGIIKSDISEHIMDVYEDAPIFACTKRYLLKSCNVLKEENILTSELNSQIENIVNSKIESIHIDGGWEWKEYKKLQESLNVVRESNWATEKKEEFVLSAAALINLFNTAVFPIKILEDAIANQIIHSGVISPMIRLNRLNDIASTTESLKDICLYIVNMLRQRYEELYSETNKHLELKRYVEVNSQRSCVIVVPKAYYKDVLIYSKTIQSTDNIICVTPNKYNAFQCYDSVLVTGNIIGKRFDPLQNHSTPVTEVMLYDYEEIIFKFKKRKAIKLEKRLNSRLHSFNKPNYDNKLPEVIENEEFLDANINDSTFEKFTGLDEYIEQISILSISKTVSNMNRGSVNLPMSTVSTVGTFLTGEKIFFSKNYSAVVFDPDNGTVIESTVDKLTAGDTLVFINRNDYTKNVVDVIYEQLLAQNMLSNDVRIATEKAMYWKEALRLYKEKEKLTYRGVANQLAKYGSTLQEVSIRQWLLPDSHIVGPRNVQTMIHIANATNDENLLNNPEDYFESCRIVRHQRKEILNLIGKAINDKLSGHMPKVNSIFAIVYDNVENLSKTYELEMVTVLDKSLEVPIGLVNRPILETEVLL